MEYKYDLCIVGGLGHVGLPLSITFADKGLKVCAYDTSKETYDIVSSGKMPFIEYGAEDVLGRVLRDGSLTVSMSPETLSESKNIIITIGTPTDIHLSPEPAVEHMIEEYSKYFVDDQLIILRSTIHPGTTERVDRILKSKGKKAYVAFCPERIAQGYAMTELLEMPHIVSSTSQEGEERASELFRKLNKDILVMKPTEAELVKLFTNAYRYINFGIANQFYMIATDAGCEFQRIYDVMTYNYPRMKNFAKPGFASGPCLLKDTVHLSAYASHNFQLGNSAIMVNEGMPSYIVSKLKQKYDIKEKKIAILGMAFKANIDDKRDSLSYKLLKLLKYDAKEVLCTDPYINDKTFVPLEKAVNEADIIILGVPHKEYKDLMLGKSKIIIDIWNFLSKA